MILFRSPRFLRRHRHLLLKMAVLSPVIVLIILMIKLYNEDLEHLSSNTSRYFDTVLTNITKKIDRCLKNQTANQFNPESTQTLQVVEVFPWLPDVDRDLASYVRPGERSTLVSPKVSCTDQLLLLIVVCSSPKNWEYRKSIRETWLSIPLGEEVKVVFFLGRDGDRNTQFHVEEESSKFGDIVQEDFLDTTFNQTVKSVMMLKWVTTTCDGVQYVLKTEENVFINVHFLLNLVENLNVPTELLMGRLVEKEVVSQIAYRPRYTPASMYSKETFPNYLDGMAYIMSNNVVNRLFKRALTTPLFHLEEVFLTGIVAEIAGVEPEDNEAFRLIALEDDPCMFRPLQSVTVFQSSSAEFMRCRWSTHLNAFLECGSF